jgi:predicted ABC-type ATPase
MAKIYIIAGPPGIGKSTSGRHFVPPSIEILNHDSLLLHYKYNEEVDYEDLANLKANNFVLEQLTEKNNFGIELNLGFDSHYELLRLIKREHSHYQIEIVLFYTDNIEICFDRALLREKFGGHHVDSDIILKMYENTIPLIKKSTHLIHGIQLINDDFESIELVYSKENDSIFSITELPDWVKSLAPKTLNLERF